MVSAKNRTHVAIVCAVALSVVLFLTRHDWAYDDPFITYRYAQNINSGVGFVYNAGERVLSTTTPLYAVLLAALGHLWPDLPHLSNAVSVVSLFLGAYFVLRLGRSLGEPIAGYVGAVMLSLSSLMISTLGAETCFYTMLILASLSLHAEGRYRLAMLCAGLATLTRSDGVLVAGVLGIDYLLQHRRVPWDLVLIFTLVAAPWHLYAWLYFGSPLPVTLVAKQQQGQMAISQKFIAGLLTLVERRLGDWRLWPSFGLLLLGWGYATIKAQRWLLLLGWAVAYVLGYTVLGVSRYFWYYAPLVPVAAVGVGLGISVAYRALSGVLSPVLRRVWRVVFLLAALVPQLGRSYGQPRYLDPRATIYREVGRWLDGNAPVTSTVGTLEVGIIGYYSRRPMVGFAGLIQPEVAQQMSVDATYADTTVWALLQYRPDYVVANPRTFPEQVNGLIRDSCEVLRVFTHDAYDGEMIVYGCGFGAE